MFNYDWFHGVAFEQQRVEARARCTTQHFSDVDRDKLEEHEPAQKFFEELEDRTLLYMRDGFSYEVKEIVEASSKSHLVFECIPVDEQYRVGAFLVTVPFEEIVRVEVFAVHPSEKPDDLPQITGFRSFGDPDIKSTKPGRPTPPSAIRQSVSDGSGRRYR